MFHDRVGDMICEYMRENLFSNMAVCTGVEHKMQSKSP